MTVESLLRGMFLKRRISDIESYLDDLDGFSNDTDCSLLFLSGDCESIPMPESVNRTIVDCIKRTYQLELFRLKSELDKL